MAKKRLNKKVALIGSVVFVFIVLAAIAAILYLSRDPEKFIKDGDAAIKLAREATDEQIKQEEYKRAEHNYLKARSLAKTDSVRIDVLFKLVDLYLKTDQWRNVLGGLNEIVRIDPQNVRARFGRLKNFYLMAGSGLRGVWQDVATQASEFIKLAEDRDLLMEDITQWESFIKQERRMDGRHLGPYLYLVRGRATFEMATIGAVADPNESLTQAVADLKKVQELEPNNIDAYWYLAKALKKRGEILALGGDLEGGDRAAEEALELLRRAVEVAGASPRTHINLVEMKREIMRDQSDDGRTLTEEQVQSLEPEYLSLIEKFPSSAEAFSALANFYRLRLKNPDKAIEAAEKAVELDRENVPYAIIAANLHYLKFSIYGQESEIHKAIEEAKNALTLPNTQDTSGPRQWANRMNRIALYSFLAHCYIEQIIEPREVRTESQKQELLTEAEHVVHELEQLLGTGESPEVIRWQGMLELAKGNRNIAIRKLYPLYQQIRPTKPPDNEPWPAEPLFAHLSYTLAKLFKNTSEVGAVDKFLICAIKSGVVGTKPEARLDYAEVLLKLDRWVKYQTPLHFVKWFEEGLGANERSQILRISSYIRLGPGKFFETEKRLEFDLTVLTEDEKKLAETGFERAEKELAKRKPDDANTIKLNLALVQAKIKRVKDTLALTQEKESLPVTVEDLGTPGEANEANIEPESYTQLVAAELKRYRGEFAELVEELLEIEPNSVEVVSIRDFCNYCIQQGQLGEAEALVNTFLKYIPDNTVVLFYKQILSEPDPGEIPQQRQKEIEEQILSSIADPARRAINLGRFYQKYNELEKAAAEFRKVFEAGSVQEGVVKEPAFEQTEEMTDLRRLATSYLFEIALVTKDWQVAEQIAEMARRENLDKCEGQFFAARLAMAKEEYKDALDKFGECLKQRPVFSLAYMFRSKVNEELGPENELASLEDAVKAASLNPLNGNITKRLALVLWERNRRIREGGGSVTDEQRIETKNAFIRALKADPGNLELLKLYAEFIGEKEPLAALSIRQYLQKYNPSVENALLAGRTAMRMAINAASVAEKEDWFDIAEPFFKDAIDVDPQSRVALESYAEYYRVSGQDEKAEQLLLDAGDQQLLWTHYFWTGRFNDAKRVLEQLYKSDANDTDVVKGLLVVGQRTNDGEAVKRYSEELLLLEDSTINRLLQIQTFLQTGLVREVEYKLQSFKERYPDESRSLLFEAWLAMRQGRIEDAWDKANKYLERNQNNATAWRVRGQINLLRGKVDPKFYVKAIDDLRKSKSLSLDDPVTQITLARAYDEAGRVEDAITELENTIDHPQAPAEGRRLLEDIYVRGGRKEALTRFYDRTLESAEGGPDELFWYKRAGRFAMTEKQFNRAEQVYGRAWQISREAGKADAAVLDGYLEALVSGAGTPEIARSVWNPSKLDKVFEEGRKYVDGDFAPIAYWWMAEAKMKLGDKTTAKQYCRTSLTKAFEGTNELLASEILQRAYRLMGAEEVSEYCEQRLEIHPDSLAANLAMFDLMRIKGRHNEAIGYIDKCLEIAGPDSPRKVDYVRQKTEVLQRAYAKTSDNNYLERSIKEYESLLAKMPNNTVVLNNLAYTLAQNNERLEEALEYARRAYEVSRNHPGFVDTYAYLLHKNGRNSEAEKVLLEAVQQFEQHEGSAPAEVYEHLGMIKEGLGVKEEAIAAYKRALKIGADRFSETVKERITAAIERLSR